MYEFVYGLVALIIFVIVELFRGKAKPNTNFDCKRTKSKKKNVFEDVLEENYIRERKKKDASLLTWVKLQREKYAKGELSKYQMKALEETRGWAWTETEEEWKKYYQSLRAEKEEE